MEQSLINELDFKKYFKDRSLAFLSKEEQNQFVLTYVNALNCAINTPGLAAQSLSSFISYIRSLSATLVMESNFSKCNELLDCCEKITRGLRFYSEKNNAMLFYYMGTFQAEYDNLSRTTQKESSMQKKKDVLRYKHTTDILTALFYYGEYTNGDLARSLKIDSGNLSKTIKKLIDANWIEKRITTKYCYYSLTAEGYRDFNIIVKRTTNALSEYPQKDSITRHPSCKIDNSAYKIEENNDKGRQSQDIIYIIGLAKNYDFDHSKYKGEKNDFRSRQLLNSFSKVKKYNNPKYEPESFERKLRYAE